jgi:hypothetical protein
MPSRRLVYLAIAVGVFVILSITALFIYSATGQKNRTTNSSFLIGCDVKYPNGADIHAATLFLEKNPYNIASLCVKFYYYNSSSTITIEPLNQMTIFMPKLGSATGIENVNSAFSISANVSEFQIGGPKNMNEGLAVTYNISPTGSTQSGSYAIALSSGLYPKDIICAYGIYINLQVGNTTNTVGGSSCHYVPDPADNPGLIYSEIDGVTNSTNQ